jgi:hypothetical protein
MGDPTPTDAYPAIARPVLLLYGEHGSQPVRLMIEGLARLLPESRLAVVAGAGHMGPLTHAAEVSAHIVQHIRAVESGERAPRHWGPRTLADILAVPSRSSTDTKQAAPGAREGGQGAQS